MIHEVYHKTGKRTKLTGTIEMKDASIANVMGIDLLFGSDHRRGMWMRTFPGDGMIRQCAGSGETKLR